MIKTLFQFRGGVQVPTLKEASTSGVIQTVPLPEQLVLPLHQHIGNSAELIVSEGQHVLKGQKLAKADGFVSAPIHAPTSGVVSFIGDQAVPHPSGLSAPCIILKPDGKEQWVERQPLGERFVDEAPSHLRNYIRDAGIVGLGGAGFPAFIKMNPGPAGVVETLIINGSECEPYISCDDMLMRERAAEIIQGALIIKHALNAKHCVVAIEDNKLLALQSMQQAVLAVADNAIEVAAIPTIYPAGGEKQLIYTLTGKQVPSNGLPIHVNVVVQNVGTTAAIYRAVYHGEPLISRIMTVAGDVQYAGNFEVLLGTSANHMITHCQRKADLQRLIMGGPMMGFALPRDDVPIIKTTNCLLVDCGLSQELPQREAIMPCIRCGACADVCPVNLLPQQLYWHARAENLTAVQDYHLFDCIECGCCDFVCPAKIPLVQYYRFAKADIWAKERETHRSDIARERHEFRQFRLEREKEERAARHKQKKAALKQPAESPAEKPAVEQKDPKQAAILAAMERVKAKKSTSAVKPKNTENLTEQQQKQIDEANQRRFTPDSSVEPEEK